MKKVIGILAVVAFASSIASAQLLKNVKYNGSVEVKSVTVDNSDFNKDAEDKYSNAKTRVMLGVNFDLNDDANAQVTFAKYNRTWGDQLGTGVQSEEDVDNLTANIDITEAYLNLKNVLGLNHKVGRQTYGNAGDIVIYYGPSAQNVAAYSVQALDAWYGEWKKDKLSVGAVMGKVWDRSAVTMFDHDVYGLTAAFDYSEIIKPSAYVYQSDDRTTAANITDKLNVIGVKATGKFSGLGYAAEYAMNTGNNHNTDVDYKGSAMKLNADYGLDAGFGNFTLLGEYAMGTGDKTSATKNEKFTAVNNNYVPGLIFGGLGVGAANTGLGNLTTFNAGVKFTPKSIEKLTLCGHFYNFDYTEKVGTVEKIGTELDFGAAWKHSDNVFLKASYAMFTPDNDFSANDDAKSLLGLDAVVKF